MKWCIEEIAREEEKKGKKVWVEYGNIRIEETWWRWNEREEVLKMGVESEEKNRKRRWKIKMER